MVKTLAWATVSSTKGTALPTGKMRVRERGRGRWVSETGSFVIAGKMLIESDALIATHTSRGPEPRSLDVC